MSNELHAETTTGLTLYAVLLSSTGQVWNGAAWEAIAGANWLTYDLAMTEAAAGIYLATMPSVAAGAYSYVVYSQAGVNPAITDSIKGTGYLQWDGAAETLWGPDNAIEGAYTERQLMRLVAAVLAGKSSGGGTTAYTIRDINDTVDRIVATLTADGDRTAVTLDAS